MAGWKTILFALLFFAVNLAGYFGWKTYQPDTQTAELIGAVVAIVVALLRFFTKTPIFQTTKPE
jgi:uncharacterized membrane protein